MSLKWSSSIINQSRNQKGFYWFHPWLYLFEMSLYLCTRHRIVAVYLLASDGSQSVRRRTKFATPCFISPKKEHNLNYSTTTRPAHRHTYTYTHTSVHIYTCTQTNREKSFESGLWLAGVAVKCQLMGMFVQN